MDTPPRFQLASLASLRLGRRVLVAGAVGLAISWLVSTSARADSPPAESFVVIVNVRNPARSADRDFVADAFLKKASRWDDGEALRPGDLRTSAAARRAFSTAVLQRSVAAVRSYWQQCIFSGRNVPPPELDSDEAMLRYVAKYRGAVGYVSGATKLDGSNVKVIVVR
jgi:hypothetical protein